MAATEPQVTAEPLQNVRKRYCSSAIFVAIVIATGLIIAGQVSLGKGLILGTLFSIVNFLLLGSAIQLKVEASRRKMTTIALGSIAGRFLLLAIPMAIAIKMETFHVVPTVIGIFMVQVMILADYLIRPLLENILRKLSGDC